MCTYCMIADWGRQAFPPWPSPYSNPPYQPLEPHFPPPPPMPVAPTWTREQLDEFERILKSVKAMEDKLGGCPCEEPGKLDYLKQIRERLDALDGKIQPPA